MRIEDDETAVTLRWRQIPVVTQPQLEGDVWPPLIVVLDEEGKRFLRDAARLAAESHTERVCRVRKKRGNAREVKRAGSQPEIVVQELLELAADLQRIPSAGAARRVGNHEGRVAATGWIGRRTAEIQSSAGDVDLRQADRLRNTVPNAEIGGVELRIGPGGAGLAIQAEAQLIDAAAESMGFAERKKLPQGRLDVSEAGNGISPPARFYRLGAIDVVKHVQPCRSC